MIQTDSHQMSVWLDLMVRKKVKERKREKKERKKERKWVSFIEWWGCGTEEEKEKSKVQKKEGS